MKSMYDIANSRRVIGDISTAFSDVSWNIVENRTDIVEGSWNTVDVCPFTVEIIPVFVDGSRRSVDDRYAF